MTIASMKMDKIRRQSVRCITLEHGWVCEVTKCLTSVELNWYSLQRTSRIRESKRTRQELTRHKLAAATSPHSPLLCLPCFCPLRPLLDVCTETHKCNHPHIRTGYGFFLLDCTNAVAKGRAGVESGRTKEVGKPHSWRTLT
jgi:hypothetical protein